MNKFNDANLTQKPSFMNWPATHYVYTEKVDPFMQTAPAAWAEFGQVFSELANEGKMKGAMALYKLRPELIYRAGAIFDSAPTTLPSGFKYEKFQGGDYWKFALKGSYAQLPEACARVFELSKLLALETRPDFYIEHYVNDPKKTPEAELLTEILIPAKGSM